MSSSDYPIDDALLQQIADTIVEVVHPVKILLFGSRARGDFRPDSDLDLMIIVEHSFGPAQSRWGLTKSIRRALRKYSISKDLVTYNIDEFEHWKPSLNHVIGHAAREGKVLYDRSSTKS